MKDTITVELVIKPQHIKIAQLLSDGNNVAAVAKQLKCNVRSLEATISRMKQKYNADTLPHLVSIFFRNELIK